MLSLYWIHKNRCISEYTAEDPETRTGTLSNELEIKNVIELTKIVLGRNHDKIFSMKSKNLQLYKI